MQPGLRNILDTIQPVRDGGPTHFVAKSVPNFPSHFVGWDQRSAPCILIQTSDFYFRAPLHLAGLDVRYCMQCDVSLPGEQRNEQTLTVVTCTSADRATQDYFLHLMETILRIVGHQPSLVMVEDSIARLVEILQQLAQPPRRGVIGLYGELVVIAQSADPSAALAAWRVALDDRFDFAVGEIRLEAKATSDRVRAHHFSFEQTSPPRQTLGIVASLFVERSGGGESLEEIVTAIDSRLGQNNEARMKLHSTIARSLGSSLPASLDTRFDSHLARSSLAFYLATDIPAVRDAPRQVSQIRFFSSLSGVPALDLATFRSATPTAAPLLPVV